MEILTDPEEIYEAYHRMLVNVMTKSRGVRARIGIQSGSSESVVHWREDLNLWVNPSMRILAEKRYWVGWGVGKPELTGSTNIVCETNIAAEGYNRRLGSLFIKSPDGIVFLTHNGKIGGSRRGVGKTAFWQQYAGNNQPIHLSYPDGQKGIVALIGAIDYDGFPELMSAFVHEVARIKKVLTK